MHDESQAPPAHDDDAFFAPETPKSAVDPGAQTSPDDRPPLPHAPDFDPGWGDGVHDPELHDQGFFTDDAPLHAPTPTAPPLRAADPLPPLTGPARAPFGGYRPSQQAPAASSATLVPPSDLLAERAILGCFLLDPQAAINANSHVSANEYYEARHQAICETTLKLAMAGRPTDPVTVLSELRQAGKGDLVSLPYLLELTENVGSTLSVEHFARRIRALAKVRDILKATHKVTAEGYRQDVDPDAFLQIVEAEIGAALRESVPNVATPIAPVAYQVFNDVLLARQRGGDNIGVPTGFRDLDKLLLGLHASDLLVLAARPAMGKTALALNLALQVALRERRDGQGPHDRHGVLIFSLEMGREQLVQRFLSARSRIGLTALRKGEITPEDEVVLRDTTDELSQLNVFIDDTPALTSIDVRARARRVQSQAGGKLELVVVDYLQLMRGTGGAKQSREQEISEISRSLKGLAKELNTTVLALSQLNRGVEGRADKRPMMSDLRESGAIEQDADIIAFIYRDHVYNEASPEHVAELIIAKHRAGATDTIQLHFEPRMTKFSNLDDRVDDRYVYGNG
jgi:replicative DNA helicase